MDSKTSQRPSSHPGSTACATPFSVVSAAGNYLNNERNSSPTIERPFMRSLLGNDDASWGRVFSPLNELHSVLDEIERENTRSFVRGNLGFTN